MKPACYSNQQQTVLRVISISTSASLSEIGLGMEEKERENEVSDIYEVEFGIIALCAMS